eukprot:2709962-Rhodomonas_salina.1
MMVPGVRSRVGPCRVSFLPFAIRCSVLTSSILRPDGVVGAEGECSEHMHCSAADGRFLTISYFSDVP